MITRIGPKKPLRFYLAEWRIKRHLTQEQLAERVETTKATISRWENQERDAGGKALAALADALNLEVPDLYRNPEMPSADALMRDARPEDQVKALRLVATLLNKAVGE
ncbi:MAG TPA: helix-turn-helix transcriptional regulator [Aestuariivirga sp.]|nr:helix-turn-helix transcriptional regulator [Aestuariivirga sp.]